MWNVRMWKLCAHKWKCERFTQRTETWLALLISYEMKIHLRFLFIKLKLHCLYCTNIYQISLNFSCISSAGQVWKKIILQLWTNRRLQIVLWENNYIVTWRPCQNPTARPCNVQCVTVRWQIKHPWRAIWNFVIWSSSLISVTSVAEAFGSSLTWMDMWLRAILM